MEGKKDCCRNPENLTPVETGRPDLVVKVCERCKLRHFEVTVDPGSLGLRGGRMG